MNCGYFQNTAFQQWILYSDYDGTSLTGATQLVPENRNRSIFQNAVFPSEYQITGRAYRPINIRCNIPSLELQAGTISLKIDGK